MTKPKYTNAEYLAWIDKNLEIQNFNVKVWTNSLGNAKNSEEMVRFSLRLGEAQNNRASLLANRDVLVRHEPEIRYVIGESEGSFDSEQELLDTFTEQELKDSPPEITTFTICSWCGELNSTIQEGADEWVYQPEVYFPCPTYLDIAQRLDEVM